MPVPMKGEPKKKFVSRAISVIMKEPKTKSHKHAIAKAYGIYRQAKKKKIDEAIKFPVLMLEYLRSKRCKKKKYED